MSHIVDHIALRTAPFALVLLLLAVPVAHAQSATVRGFVTDEADGQPLQGVNVVVEGLGGPTVGVEAGTATGRDGVYALSRLPAGRYAFRASFIGFETVRDTLVLAGGTVESYNVVMVEEEAALDEVVVETERTTGAARVTAGQVSIQPRDIERIPSPDISGDLVNYLTTVPGIVTLGDRGGQLFVRGGEPWHNLVLLDGMLVYQPFHILGFFSSFPADLISRTDIYAGGFSSRYGGRLASVIDVATRHGNKKTFAGSGSVAPFVSSLLVEGPIAPDRVSLMLSLRRSVIEQGAANLVSAPLPFDFGDFYGKVHAIINRNNQVSFSALRTFDRGVLGEDVGGTVPEAVRWRNEAYGMRYLILPRNFPIFAEILMSASRLRTDQGPDEAEPLRASTVGRFNAEANITHFAGPTAVQWGLFARTLRLESELDGLFQGVFLRREYVTEVGVYVEPEIQLGAGLQVRTGVRMHAFPSKGQAFFEPRLRAVWKRGQHQWSGAFGVYHQEIIGLTDRRDAASIFTAWTANPFARVPRAIHLLGGYLVTPTPWLELSAEAYYKWLDELFVPEWTAFPRFTTRLQPADGRAFGFDVRVEVQRAWFYGFVTYGLSSVEYEAKQESLALWYGSETLPFRPPHDRRHQLNALASVTVRQVEIGVRWQFGSGLPFSRALGFDGFVLLDGPLDVFEEPGSRRVIYERPYNGVLPAYHRLDVTAERTFRFNRAALTLQAGVINVYDRRNLFYLDVFTLRRVDQLPLIPTFGLKVAFE